MEAEPRRVRIVNPRLPVALALGLAAGVCAAFSLGSLGIAVTAAAAVAIALLNALTLKRTAVYIFALAFLLGAVRAILLFPSPPAQCTGELSGIVADAPQAEYGQTVYTLKRVTVNGEAVSGKVRLTVYGPDAPYAEYGDRLSASSRISVPEAALNEGGFNKRTYLVSKGVTALASAADASIASGQGGLMGAAIGVRLRLKNAIDELYPQNAGLIKGILLGDTSDIDHEILTAYRTTGMAHILALSGLHISILAGALTALLRGARPWLRYLLVTLFIIAYLFITGFPVSLIRAAIMSLMLFAAHLLGRRYDSLCAIGAAAAVILLILPYSVYSVGFVLSFSACIGIALLSPIFQRAVRAVPRRVSSLFSTPLGAILGVAPFSALYFGAVNPLSIVCNVILLPLLYILLLPALPLAALFLALPSAAGAAAHPLDIAGSAMNYWIERLGALDLASFSVPSPSLTTLALVYTAYFCASDFLMLKWRIKAVLLCALAALTALSVTLSIPDDETALLACRGGAAAVVHTDEGAYAALPFGAAGELEDYAAHRGLTEYEGIVCLSREDVLAAIERFPKAPIAALTAEAALAAAESGAELLDALPFEAAAHGDALLITLDYAEITLSGGEARINGAAFDIFVTGQLNVQNVRGSLAVDTYNGKRIVIE